MVRFLSVALAALVMLSGCTSVSAPNDEFKTVPVYPREPITYTCLGAEEIITDFTPDYDKLQIWPYNVTVVDTGAKWRAIYPMGYTESAQLFRGKNNRLDGAVDPASGDRYYRVNYPEVTFSYTSVDANGNGTGLSFFHCQ